MGFTRLQFCIITSYRMGTFRRYSLFSFSLLELVCSHFFIAFLFIHSFLLVFFRYFLVCFYTNFRQHHSYQQVVQIRSRNQIDGISQGIVWNFSISLEKGHSDKFGAVKLSILMVCKIYSDLVNKQCFAVLSRQSQVKANTRKKEAFNGSRKCDSKKVNNILEKSSLNIEPTKRDSRSIWSKASSICLLHWTVKLFTNKYSTIKWIKYHRFCVAWIEFPLRLHIHTQTPTQAGTYHIFTFQIKVASYFPGTSSGCVII